MRGAMAAGAGDAAPAALPFFGIAAGTGGN